ncbi:hypothetical protein EYF80_005042 [Liparis tanakae]|uniref:Uncharacterized protein n=1 Tax=Liparis tanakae TaxID=230148 RepID=A0A4Z2J3N3_9TELE|nr:hypothetical protein EYF80_005042 [Liparis tanakae]
MLLGNEGYGVQTGAREAVRACFRVDPGLRRRLSPSLERNGRVNPEERLLAAWRGCSVRFGPGVHFSASDVREGARERESKRERERQKEKQSERECNGENAKGRWPTECQRRGEGVCGVWAAWMDDGEGRVGQWVTVAACGSELWAFACFGVCPEEAEGSASQPHEGADA